jgi:phosphoenolpyruvate synthase/pyruvate phosphate dikinase
MDSRILGKALNLPITVLDVGGKGWGLMTILDRFSEKYEYKVPHYQILPTSETQGDINLEMIIRGISHLKRPLAVRSSSPYEDGRTHSLAGRFATELNVTDENLLYTIRWVRDSGAMSDPDRIDNNMAVILQEMINADFSGVAYSSLPTAPELISMDIVEGVSERLTAGKTEGVGLSIDLNCQSLEIEYCHEAAQREKFGRRLFKLAKPWLEKIARTAKALEAEVGYPLDLEFGVKRPDLFLWQARAITEPMDTTIYKLPTIDPNLILLDAEIVRGKGEYSGPIFVLPSGDNVFEKGIKDIWFNELYNLRGYDRTHPAGYILVTPDLVSHKLIIDDLKNLKGLITTNLASRFSHALTVARERGILYLGCTRPELIDTLITDDKLSIASDGRKGIAYNHIPYEKPIKHLDLSSCPHIDYNEAIGWVNPPYENVDDRVFVKGDKELLITDYNYYEHLSEGIPIPSPTTFICVVKGVVVNKAAFPPEVLPRDIPSFYGFGRFLSYLFDNYFPR